MRAQFLVDCGQLTRSLQDLDEAISIYQSIGDQHGEGRTLIGKGRALGSSGFVEQAIPCLMKGLELVSVEEDPRLELVAKHNLAEYLSNCGHTEEALRLLDETRGLHAKLSNPVDLVRLKWLEGKIKRDLGELEDAEKFLLSARSYFAEQSIAFDTALISLDLAMVYLKQGRIADLKKLSSEMVTIFNGLGVQRELFAAIAFFKKALEIEQSAAMGLLQELVEVIEKSRRKGSQHPTLGLAN